MQARVNKGSWEGQWAGSLWAGPAGSLGATRKGSIITEMIVSSL